MLLPDPTTSGPVDPGGRLDAIVSRLRSAGCVFAEDEAALILAESQDPRALELRIQRRETGEPLESILGWAEFHGRRISVDAGVFVPRRRTALLVDLALPLLDVGDRFLDLCCGSGAVGAVIESAADVEVWASDIDPAAVRCARRNIRGTVVEGDLFEALPIRLRRGFSVVAVNAPYVPSEQIALMPRDSRLHEPRAAVDGGLDGVDVQRRVIAAALEWLTADGSLIIETSRHQCELTVAAFVSAGWSARVHRSDELDASAVIGRP